MHNWGGGTGFHVSFAQSKHLYPKDTGKINNRYNKKNSYRFVFLHFVEICRRPEYFYFTNTSKLNFKIVRKFIVMQKKMEVRIG